MPATRHNGVVLYTTLNNSFGAVQQTFYEESTLLEKCDFYNIETLGRVHT